MKEKERTKNSSYKIKILLINIAEENMEPQIIVC